LADTPAEAAERTLGALLVVRDLLRSRAGQGSLDELLFYGALAGVLPQPRCPALLSGGVAGLLHGAGRLPDAELVKLLGGSLQAAVAPGRQPTAFLTGLLRASRELAWRQPALVRAVEDLLEAWSDEEFVRRIPDLRMAFADLTPQETDRVAAVVAGLHGGEQVGRLHRPDLDEAALLDALRLEGLVKQSLGQDGLAGWIEPPAPAAPPGEASP
jgi:hypothetical protein